MKLVLGTRGSELALWQSKSIASIIQSKYPEVIVELKIIKTKGDVILQKPLDKIGGKGLFVKEIEQQLLNGDIDFAVHSLKDMPSEQPDGLCIVYGSKREDARDVLVVADDKSVENGMDDIKLGACLGTGAIRRKLQIQLMRNDISFKPIRGNVGTRINKIDTENLDGAVLAYAGLNRLGLFKSSYYVFSYDEMVPAAGQGILALECREDDKRVLDILNAISDVNTVKAAKLERTFLNAVDGGCHTPTGAYADVNGDEVTMYMFYASPSGDRVYKKTWSGKYDVAIREVIAFAQQAKKQVDEC